MIRLVHKIAVMLSPTGKLLRCFCPWSVVGLLWIPAITVAAPSVRALLDAGLPAQALTALPTLGDQGIQPQSLLFLARAFAATGDHTLAETAYARFLGAADTLTTGADCPPGELVSEAQRGTGEKLRYRVRVDYRVGGETDGRITRLLGSWVLEVTLKGIDQKGAIARYRIESLRAASRKGSLRPPTLPRSQKPIIEVSRFGLLEPASRSLGSNETAAVWNLVLRSLFPPSLPPGLTGPVEIPWLWREEGDSLQGWLCPGAGGNQSWKGSVSSPRRSVEANLILTYIGGENLGILQAIKAEFRDSGTDPAAGNSTTVGVTLQATLLRHIPGPAGSTEQAPPAPLSAASQRASNGDGTSPVQTSPKDGVVAIYTGGSPGGIAQETTENSSLASVDSGSSPGGVVRQKADGATLVTVRANSRIVLTEHGAARADDWPAARPESTPLPSRGSSPDASFAPSASLPEPLASGASSATLTYPGRPSRASALPAPPASSASSAISTYPGRPSGTPVSSSLSPEFPSPSEPWPQPGEEARPGISPVSGDSGHAAESSSDTGSLVAPASGTQPLPETSATGHPARRLLEERRFHEALRFLNDEIRQGPSPATYLLLAKTYLMLERDERAGLILSKKAIARHPTAEAHGIAGQFCHRLRLYDQALEHLNRAKPFLSEQETFVLGDTLLRVGRSQEGRQILRNLLATGPSERVASEVREALERSE